MGLWIVFLFLFIFRSTSHVLHLKIFSIFVKKSALPILQIQPCSAMFLLQIVLFQNPLCLNTHTIRLRRPWTSTFFQLASWTVGFSSRFKNSGLVITFLPPCGLQTLTMWCHFGYCHFLNHGLKPTVRELGRKKALFHGHLRWIVFPVPFATIIINECLGITFLLRLRAPG